MAWWRTNPWHVIIQHICLSNDTCSGASAPGHIKNQAEKVVGPWIECSAHLPSVYHHRKMLAFWLPAPSRCYPALPLLDSGVCRFIFIAAGRTHWISSGIHILLLILRVHIILLTHHLPVANELISGRPYPQVLLTSVLTTSH